MDLRREIDPPFDRPRASWRLHPGDAATVLATLPRKSVQCIVTSPPYFNLRDYHADGQIGVERRPEQYLRRLVETFNVSRRVLRDDGCLWVNLGDSYVRDGMETTLPKKSLLLIPHRFAMAMQDAGWILRTDIVWSKPNATPESVADRPSRSHEYLFLFTQRARYFYDRDAVREPNVGKPPTGRKAANLANRARRDADVLRGVRRPVSSVNEKEGKWANVAENHGGFVAWNPRGRNKRSVWHLPVSCFHPKTVGVNDVDHFAMFPPGLIEPCVLASTSEAGCCPRCGAPFKRVIASYEDLEDAWVPTCTCPPAEPVPCTVMDIFSGSGTTGTVALRHGRHYQGIELNPAYIRLAEARLASASRKRVPPMTTFPTGEIIEGDSMLVLQTLEGSDNH